MPLEAEVSRSRGAQHSHQKQTKRKLTKQQLAKRKLEIAQARKQRLDLLPTTLSDNQVLTFKEWCAVNALSERNGRRLLSGGNGPPIVRLSPKRIGVRVAANKLWQASRERT
jgi:hypothetical protein